VSEKTEQPTPRRLRRARDEGDSGASPYATQAVAFLVAVAVAPAAGIATADRARADLFAVLRASARRAPLRFEPLHLASEVLALSAPLVSAVAAAALVVHAAQTHGIVALRRLAPRFDRLDPAAGMRALFSGIRLLSVIRALVAAAAVGGLAYGSLREHLSEWARLAARPTLAGHAISAAAQALAVRAGLVGLVLGAIDAVAVRQSWLRRLRMTKDEVRREQRDSEGDPQNKAARERAYHEMLAQATIADVKGASVVVVNPTHFACALRYEGRLDDDVPVVTARGSGSLAICLANVARDRGVPVVRRPHLARALVQLDPGDPIPETLYEAVAEILSLIAREPYSKAL